MGSPVADIIVPAKKHEDRGAVLDPKASRIGTEIDFGQEGKQTGFLRLPHSVHRSAYGWLPVPIVCLKNGDGPRVLLVAGNHGDEYEGQVILSKLCRELEASDICGRVVILPAANLPAVRAGMRTSPFEQGEVGNLNRSFPGNPLGGPTAMMAHYIENVLLAESDYVFDLHSGGSSLMFLPCALMKKSSDELRTQKTIDLLRAFGAPITFVDLVDTDETLSGAARRRGVIHMGTELGGAGTTTPSAMAIGEQGLRRALAYIGLLREPESSKGPETRLVEVGGPEYYVYSMEDGVFEPLVELGDEVEKGQPAGRINFPEKPWQQPSMATFQRSGMVLCERIPGRTERGDCLFHLATDYVE